MKLPMDLFTTVSSTDGLPHGSGKHTDADGRVTSGQFNNGWPDGEVEVTTPDGHSNVEVWANGEKVSG